MRVSIVGYGAVADIHARRLRSAGVELAAVCGPDPAKAGDFAAKHGFANAVAEIEQACESAEAVIVASPSRFHFEHGTAVLACGVPALIELPACSSLTEARQLGETAKTNGVAAMCAHTSRYLEPNRRIAEWIGAGILGEIRHLAYFRSVQPAPRTWIDDALRHHAAHPVDLLFYWFGDAILSDCAGRGWAGRFADVALLARLPNGAPATIGVSYSARPPSLRLVIAGSRRTVVSDGFGVLESDDGSYSWRGDPQSVYESAILAQDQAFLQGGETKAEPVRWTDTERLVRFLGEARKCAAEDARDEKCGG
jgi:2-hydroxy-4-carboxymuconate semialdehyde hemiacetal dehydrogenase